MLANTIILTMKFFPMLHHFSECNIILNISSIVCVFYALYFLLEGVRMQDLKLDSHHPKKILFIWFNESPLKVTSATKLFFVIK